MFSEYRKYHVNVEERRTCLAGNGHVAAHVLGKGDEAVVCEHLLT